MAYDTIFYCQKTCCNDFQFPCCFTTPLPRAHGSYSHQPGPYPRNYSRDTSRGTFGYSPPAFSPRYNSAGYYATAPNESGSKSSWSSPPAFSPRYNSAGCYATVPNESGSKSSWSSLHFDAPPIRQRRKSFSTPTHTTRPTSSSKTEIPKATEADALKRGIPSGYSLKYWDPSQEPIMLLGSVFDANSLGKWIYDWAVYYHRATASISSIAGKFWELLILLEGKVKYAKERMPWIRTAENREMVGDFINSGERLKNQLNKLLKSCEIPMLKAGKKHRKDSAQLRENAASEFVDSIFIQQLEVTEAFMKSIRLWALRFDVNCIDILRMPGQ